MLYLVQWNKNDQSNNETFYTRHNNFTHICKGNFYIKKSEYHIGDFLTLHRGRKKNQHCSDKWRKQMGKLTQAIYIYIRQTFLSRLQERINKNIHKVIFPCICQGAKELKFKTTQAWGHKLISKVTKMTFPVITELQFLFNRRLS